MRNYLWQHRHIVHTKSKCKQVNVTNCDPAHVSSSYFIFQRLQRLLRLFQIAIFFIYALTLNIQSSMEIINNVQWLIFLQICTCFTFAYFGIIIFFSLPLMPPHTRTVTINNIFSLYSFDNFVLTLVDVQLVFHIKMVSLLWPSSSLSSGQLLYISILLFITAQQKGKTNRNKLRINYGHRRHEPPKLQKNGLAWSHDWLVCVCVSTNVFVWCGR